VAFQPHVNNGKMMSESDQGFYPGGIREYLPIDGSPELVGEPTRHSGSITAVSVLSVYEEEDDPNRKVGVTMRTRYREESRQ